MIKLDFGIALENGGRHGDEIKKYGKLMPKCKKMSKSYILANFFLGKVLTYKNIPLYLHFEKRSCLSWETK